MTAVQPRSGLVIEVPEAESAVGPLRDLLDANARLGVPAHVTILFPFVPAREVDAGLVDRLAETLASQPAFDYRFSRTAWFDTDVLWLAPDDPTPFRRLTERVCGAFPAHPPFEGAFAEVVPHLTVGHQSSLAALQAAERRVLTQLPITGRAHAVSLLVQDDAGRWSRTARIPLAG